MTEAVQNSSWITRKVQEALQQGFSRAYETIKVEPQDFILYLRTAHGLPVQSYDGMVSVPVDQLDDIALQTIRAGMKMAAAEGAGMGIGGMLTLVPDLGILSAITMRTVQKLSLVYGFQYNTDEEVADLWVAAATAAGVDVSREILERSVVQRFVPRVIQKIAASASAEVVEKWTGRMIPLASSVIGAALNYYFVRAWGERAMAHFRERHMRARAQYEATHLLPKSGEASV